MGVESPGQERERLQKKKPLWCGQRWEPGGKQAAPLATEASTLWLGVVLQGVYPGNPQIFPGPQVFTLETRRQLWAVIWFAKALETLLLNTDW